MKKFFTLIAVFAMAMANSAAFAQTVVLDENFDAFSNGSVEAPGTVDITGYSSTIEHRLANILSGWSGRYIYEAGGALLIKDGGNIQTGYLNTSTDGASARATFRMKCKDSYGGAANVSIGYATTITVTSFDSEWHTMTVYFTGSSYSKLKIEPYFSASGIIIDDLKVETSPAFVAAPEVYQPIDASKTEFTASWKKVTGATGYQLNVYSYNGSDIDYLLHDELVSTNSKKVTGLDASKRYFYTVKTVKGEYVSEESEEIEVLPVYASIDAPVAIAASNVTAEGFTANWNAVDIADSYIVSVAKIETLAEAKEAVVITDDFSGVTKGTISSPDLGTMSEASLDAYTANPGWVASNACYANGHIGIAPYGSTGYIHTPVLNLSGANGAFSVDIKVCANAYGSFKDDEIKVMVCQEGSTEPLATETVALTSAGFTTKHIDFNCGTANTYVRIEYTGNNKVLIDDFAINQSLAAGSTIKTIIATETTEELSKTFALEVSENLSYEYFVQAQVRTVVSGNITTIASAASNAITVSSTATAIKNIPTTSADKTIYDLTGRKVLAPAAGQIYIQNGKKVRF